MKSMIQCDSGSIANLGVHRNPGLEIVYLQEGELAWCIEGHTETVSHDSLFFSLPWQEHGSTREYEPGHQWHYVLLRLARDYRTPQSSFAFHPELGFGAREAEHLSRVLCRTHHHNYPVSARATWLLPTIVREAQEPGPCSDTLVISLVRALIVELARCILASTAAASQAPPDSVKRVAALIAKVAAAPEEPWTLTSMARACGLGRTQAAALLKHKTGDTPITFVNRARIQKALALLRNTTKSITDIAFECGFNTSQYFAKTFKSFVLCDARTYRRRHDQCSRR